MTAIISDPLPDFAFNFNVNYEAYAEWANDPANQTEENFKQAGVFHPIIRAIWEKRGFIRVEKDSELDLRLAGALE